MNSIPVRSELKTPTLLAFIVLIGALIRAAFLSDPWRSDETFTFLSLARFPLSVSLHDYADANNHPLLTVLMHGLYKTIGFSEIGLRTPDYISGLLAMLLTFIYTRLTFRDGRAALLAAAFLCFSKVHIYFSTNARGYELQSFLVLLMAVTGSLSWTWERPWRAKVCLGFLGFLILYTIPTGVFFLIPFCLGFLLFPSPSLPAAAGRHAVVLQAGLLTAALALVAYGPMARDLIHTFQHAQTSILVGSSNRCAELWTQFHSGDWPRPLGALLLFGGVVGVRAPASVRCFFLLLFVALPLATALISPFQPAVLAFPRSYCSLFPFAYALIAAFIFQGYDRLEAGKRNYYLAALLLVSAVTAVRETSGDLLNKSLLFYPERTVRATCRSLVRQIAPTLTARERIMGLNDGPAACGQLSFLYTIEARGHRGFYWIWDLYGRRIERIYLLSQERRSVDEFYSKNLDPRVWTPVHQIASENGITVYSTSRDPAVLLPPNLLMPAN